MTPGNPTSGHPEDSLDHERAMIEAAQRLAEQARAAAKAQTPTPPTVQAGREHMDAIDLPGASGQETLKRESWPGGAAEAEQRESPRPPVGAASPSPVSPQANSRERRPERVGPYRILSEIGSGGMGVVYLAEQLEPIRRRVSLKLIKSGLDTREVVARFEAERQALALMDHPNIAAIHDAGTTEDGLPYFVMEYVPGVPITDFCDRHKLPLRDRLELFKQVCGAVHHAHQKGVIHRDIKPSNILVRYHDDEKQPMSKIIDFGVAKATEQPLTDRTLFTEFGKLVGTLEYMSPEQAEMSPLGVDKRTDVYSLGVVLYELLVGDRPFDAKQLVKKGFAEIQRIIREVEPPKPSTRISTMGDRSGAVSAHRQIDPHALQKQVSGDLDWITMKALDKDRTQRYGTAADLAEDVRRYLDDEAVSAGPPGMRRRAEKYWKRHRRGVTTAALMALVAVVFGVVAFGIVRERDVEHWVAIAVVQMNAKQWDEAKNSLNKALELSGDDVAVMTNIVTVAKHLYDQKPDPEILDKALDDVDRAHKLDPKRPEPLNLKGIILRNLGRYEEAEKAHLDADQLSVKYFPNLVSLANAYALQGKWDEAESILLRATSLCQKDKEQEEPPKLQAWHNLAAIQLALGRKECRTSLGKAGAFSISQGCPELRLLNAKAALLLASPEPAQPKEALADASAVERTSDSLDAFAWRYIALANLYIPNIPDAIAAAKKAKEFGDPKDPYPDLILAVAERRQGEDKVRIHELDALIASWTEKWKKGLRATVRDGFLWIETMDELNRLRSEVGAPLITHAASAPAWQGG